MVIYDAAIGRAVDYFGVPIPLIWQAINCLVLCHMCPSVNSNHFLPAGSVYPFPAVP